MDVDEYLKRGRDNARLKGENFTLRKRVAELEKENENYKYYSQPENYRTCNCDTLKQRVAELEEESEKLRLWKWSENSDDGSHYNPVLSDICKRAGMATGYDWLKLRQALAQAMSNLEMEEKNGL